ncbi:MAG: type II toxin-antitoxin system RelE/ParE family toxin [Acidithiobacillus sp.]
MPGLREIVAHPNYIVLYRVTATCIEIVNVVHARREFPVSTKNE